MLFSRSPLRHRPPPLFHPATCHLARLRNFGSGVRAFPCHHSQTQSKTVRTCACVCGVRVYVCGCVVFGRACGEPENFRSVSKVGKASEVRCASRPIAGKHALSLFLSRPLSSPLAPYFVSAFFCRRFGSLSPVPLRSGAHNTVERVVAVDGVACCCRSFSAVGLRSVCGEIFNGKLAIDTDSNHLLLLSLETRLAFRSVDSTLFTDFLRCVHSHRLKVCRMNSRSWVTFTLCHLSSLASKN